MFADADRSPGQVVELLSRQVYRNNEECDGDAESRQSGNVAGPGPPRRARVHQAPYSFAKNLLHADGGLTGSKQPRSLRPRGVGDEY